MTNPMDEPDSVPSVVINATFPEGSTAQEIIDGRGSVLGITGSHVPPFAVITVALRAAEAAMSERIREELEDRRGPLVPAPDATMMETLVALNTRLALINTLLESEHMPSTTASFSIEE